MFLGVRDKVKINTLCHRLIHISLHFVKERANPFSKRIFNINFSISLTNEKNISVMKVTQIIYTKR